MARSELAGDARPTPCEAWRPLGVALLDYQRGRRGARLEVRSDLWEDEEVPVADYYRPDEEPLGELERRALGLCRGRVLDAGAGGGRLALELERRLAEVCALDVSPEAVEAMRARGVHNPRCGDLFDLADERYDTLLMTMHGLGVAGDLDGLDRLLGLARRLLAPGGQIVCDSADLEASLAEAEGRAPAPGRPLGERGRVRFELSYGPLRGAPYDWLFADPATLAEAAGAAGFTLEVVGRGKRGAYLARLALNEPG